MAMRKLQAEVDRTMKKVAEGVELFEIIYQKIQVSNNQPQKEKLELDLKTQIKKLQRLRDQLKTWLANSNIKDKSQLVESRRLVITQIQKYKAHEKEMKVSVFLKEQKEAADWLQSQVGGLQMQVEFAEVEIESLRSPVGKRRNKQRDKLGRAEYLEHLNERRKWHIGRLKLLLRLLNSGALSPEMILGLKEDVQHFVESNLDEDFDEDEGIYDHLIPDEEGTNGSSETNEEEPTPPPDGKNNDESMLDSSPRGLLVHGTSVSNINSKLQPHVAQEDFPLLTQLPPMEGAAIVQAVQRASTPNTVPSTSQTGSSMANPITSPATSAPKRRKPKRPTRNSAALLEVVSMAHQQPSSPQKAAPKDQSHPATTASILWAQVQQTNCGTQPLASQANTSPLPPTPQYPFGANKLPHHGNQKQPSPLFPDLPPSPRAHCRSLILEILGVRDRRVQLRKLLGQDAQILVDYLDIILHEITLQASERQRALSLLCKFAKLAGVFPRCYELRGIEYNPEPVAGGGFAEVCKGNYGDEKICLKIVRMYQKQQSDDVLRANAQELVLWAHLQHKNILPLYGVYLIGATTPRICLVSPWMENGNLCDYLIKFPRKTRMPLISDIVEGLLHLHDLHIVHRDLKAQNVLVSDDGQALITDFGLSFVVATTAVTTTGGTARFMAPEFLLENGQLTELCDIWSFAGLCYEVLTDKMPFYQYKDVQLMRALMKEEIPLRPDPGAGAGCQELNDRVWDLLVRCWNYTPQDRPSCKEIRDTIRNMQIQDDRPKTVTGTRGSSFWQAMREKSNDRLDYGRVKELLLRVRNPP